MSEILKPANEALPTMMKLLPNKATCIPAQFMDCFLALPVPARKETSRNLFDSACAASSGCKPEITRGAGAPSEAFRGARKTVM